MAATAAMAGLPAPALATAPPQALPDATDQAECALWALRGAPLPSPAVLAAPALPRAAAPAHPLLPDLKNKCRAMGLPVGGTKTQLIERIRAATPAPPGPPQRMPGPPLLPDLKDQCRAMGLPVGGTKTQLIERIRAANGAPGAMAQAAPAAAPGPPPVATTHAAPGATPPGAAPEAATDPAPGLYPAPAPAPLKIGAIPLDVCTDAAGNAHFVPQFDSREQPPPRLFAPPPAPPRSLAPSIRDAAGDSFAHDCLRPPRDAPTHTKWRAMQDAWRTSVVAKVLAAGGVFAVASIIRNRWTFSVRPSNTGTTFEATEPSGTTFTSDDAILGFLKLRTPEYAIHQRVRARFQRGATFYGGTIAKVHDDASYDVVYDDGSRDVNLEEAFVAPDLPGLTPSMLLASLRDAEPDGAYSTGRRLRDAEPEDIDDGRIRAGDRVKVHDRSGVVTQVQVDRTLDILYDDGALGECVDPFYVEDDDEPLVKRPCFEARPFEVLVPQDWSPSAWFSRADPREIGAALASVASITQRRVEDSFSRGGLDTDASNIRRDRMRPRAQAGCLGPRDLTGRFPCPAGCDRTFSHAPAAVQHGKRCPPPPPAWRPNSNFPP